MNEIEQCIFKLNQSILALHDRLSAIEKVCEEVIKRDKYLQGKFAVQGKTNDKSDFVGFGELEVVKQENIASFENFKGFKK